MQTILYYNFSGPGLLKNCLYPINLKDKIEYGQNNSKLKIPEKEEVDSITKTTVSIISYIFYKGENKD